MSPYGDMSKKGDKNRGGFRKSRDFFRKASIRIPEKPGLPPKHLAPLYGRFQATHVPLLMLWVRFGT